MPHPSCTVPSLEQRLVASRLVSEEQVREWLAAVSKAGKGESGSRVVTFRDAAAHGDGFAGDEHAPASRRHYGDLVWAGGY